MHERLSLQQMTHRGKFYKSSELLQSAEGRGQGKRQCSSSSGGIGVIYMAAAMMSECQWSQAHLFLGCRARPVCYLKALWGLQIRSSSHDLTRRFMV